MAGLEFIAYGAGFALTAAVAWTATPLVREFALSEQWIDRPDANRKIHEKATPTAGGIAIAAAVGVGLLYFAVSEEMIFSEHVVSFTLPSEVILVGAATMFVTGLYDDLDYLSYEHKFVLQVVVASIVIHDGYVIEQVPFLGVTIHLGWVGVPLTLGWIVGLVNAVNLLDGMDGLATGVALIAFGSLAAAYALTGLLATLPLVLVVTGALAGFLYHNFHPASIFMGDCGSLLIGFLLATYSLEGPSQGYSMLAFAIPILALGVPLIDTALAVVRRFLQSRPLFKADSDHIHHRLARLVGLGHRETVLTIYGLSTVFGLYALGVAIGENWQIALVVVGAALTLYSLLRWLRYFRLRDLPWLIQEREEFAELRRTIEEGRIPQEAPISQEEKVPREERIPQEGDVTIPGPAGSEQKDGGATL